MSVGESGRKMKLSVGKEGAHEESKRNKAPGVDGDERG
jgi:hypothetical protein